MFSPARRARLALATQILDVEPVYEGACHSAGRAAEAEIIEWFSQYAKGVKVFHSRRVPRHAGEKGRYEIDLLLLTPQCLSVIEVKNWSGPIHDRGETWAKRRNDGSWLVQENPVTKTELKLDALEAHLLAQGVPLPRWLSTAVVLWNDQAQPEPRLAKNPAVVLKRDIARIVPQSKAAGLNKAQMRAVEQALRLLEGFDSVTLYGGRKISGDLLRIVVGGKGYSLEDLPRCVKTRIKVPRNPIWVRFKALFGVGPMIRFTGPLKGLCAMPRDYLLFHPAGEPQPIQIPIARLLSFERG